MFFDPVAGVSERLTVRTAFYFLVTGIISLTNLSNGQAETSRGFAVSAGNDVSSISAEQSGGCASGDLAGRVAVVDLDKIATAIGRDKVINTRVQEFAKEQEKKLTQLRDELRAQLAEEKKKLGDSPNDQDRKKLSRLAENSEIRLRQQIAKVEKVADKLQIKLVLDFKQEVTPYARRVATARCMGIVMIKQNDLMFINSVSDITDAVIDDLQKYPGVTGAENLTQQKDDQENQN